MRTNAWITVERTRALTWRDWARWYESDQTGPEPPLSNYETKAVRRLVDMEYLFRAFERPTIQTRVWIMLSVYDVTPAELASGYAQLGDAAQGGDFGVAGYWQWERGWSGCQYVDIYPWLGAQVAKFMPPISEDPPIPAAGVRDVNLLLGQPPRSFPV